MKSELQNKAWLASLATRKFNPVYVELDARNCVKAISGSAVDYGFIAPRLGEPISDYFDFMFGVEDAREIEFDFIETPNGRAAHVHVESTNYGRQLILTDATIERDQRQALQQKSNELSLLTTKQAELLKQLQAINVELDSKKLEAEKLTRLQSRFIASMSHEFRTPLSSIVAYSEYLATGQEKITAADGVIAIERAAKHLLNLVENLIGQAQFEIDDIELTIVDVKLEELCNDFESLFAPLAASKGLIFELNVIKGVPDRILIDELRFRQMVINLLGNACKYTAHGSITLDINWLDGSLITKIEDTGVGISEDAQQEIWKAFDRGAVESGEGAGLGLYITKRLVDLMGGEIVIDSEVGRGTTITMSVPAAVARQVLQPARLSKGHSILVVEDDSDVYDILAIFLDEAGFEVFHADNALTALEMFAQIAPLAVVTDLNIPGGDGTSFIRQLREQGFTGSIIVLTASNLGQDRQRAKEAGCSEYVVKPISPAKLVDLIEQGARKSGE